MKFNTSSICIVLLLLFFGECNLYAQKGRANFSVATYNIRYDTVQDSLSGNSWNKRKDALFGLIKRHDFDIFGTQEGMFRQMIELKNDLSKYDYVSYPYGGKSDHHQLAIVFKKKLFKVEDAGVFWLSDTPTVPSIGWDATDRRICMWAKFKHIPSGKYFFYFNTHFYWKNKEARKLSGPLLVQMIQKIAADAPVICAGDFNSKNETSQIISIKELLNDAFDVSTNGRQGEVYTDLGGGNFQNPPKARIDYLFLSPNIVVKDYRVYSDQYADNRYPSDHLPVSCEISF